MLSRFNHLHRGYLFCLWDALVRKNYLSSAGDYDILRNRVEKEMRHIIHSKKRERERERERESRRMDNTHYLNDSFRISTPSSEKVQNSGATVFLTLPCRQPQQYSAVHCISQLSDILSGKLITQTHRRVERWLV